MKTEIVILNSGILDFKSTIIHIPSLTKYESEQIGSPIYKTIHQDYTNIKMNNRY